MAAQRISACSKIRSTLDGCDAGCAAPTDDDGEAEAGGHYCRLLLNACLRSRHEGRRIRGGQQTRLLRGVDPAAGCTAISMPFMRITLLLMSVMVPLLVLGLRNAIGRIPVGPTG